MKTLGYGNRIGIWIIGCSHHCHNCSNPELWNSNPSKDISIDNIVKCIEKIKDADGITITGGDPFEQPKELLSLVLRLKELKYEDILVYSGYTYKQLTSKGESYQTILDNIGVLIDGLYIDELNDNKSIRGSSNQCIYVLNQKLEDRYEDVCNWERQSQILLSNNEIQVIGLPMKNNERNVL